MENVQAIALFAGLIWAGQAGITAGWKYANELRNAVLTGRSDGSEISADHAALIMTNDYRTIANGMIISGLLYGLAILAIPFLTPGLPTWMKWTILALGAVQTLRPGMSFAHVRRDMKMMRAQIARRRADEPAQPKA